MGCSPGLGVATRNRTWIGYVSMWCDCNIIEILLLLRGAPQLQDGVLRTFVLRWF
jgi:hypothetical protein